MSHPCWIARLRIQRTRSGPNGKLIFGTADGIVHAMRPDGTDLPGWPVHTDPLPLHAAGHAFTSGGVDTNASYGAILSSVAVAGASPAKSAVCS